jgi:hypothetical protein
MLGLAWVGVRFSATGMALSYPLADRPPEIRIAIAHFAFEPSYRCRVGLEFGHCFIRELPQSLAVYRADMQRFDQVLEVGQAVCTGFR